MPIEFSNIAQLGSLEFLARQIVEGFITGLHKSPYHGFSVEFAEHRIYNTGEPTKNIDWKLFARTEKLFVKRYEEETNLRCQIVIDKSSSMYFPVQQKLDFDHLNKLWFSAYSSAALIELMRRQRDAVGISTFDADVDLHTEAKLSRTHINMIYSELEKLMSPYDKSVKTHTNAIQSLHKIAEMTHKRSLVIIFSDMLDSLDSTEELFAALKHLRYNKHEVVLFHVFDSVHEQKLDYDNRPHRFVDMETDEILKLNPSDVKEYYEKIMTARKNELLSHCHQYQIDYVEADIDNAYNQILTSYLIKRQKLI